MKRIIDGKTYNTETATLISEAYFTDDPKSEGYDKKEALFQTRHGAFFVAVEENLWDYEAASWYVSHRAEPKPPPEALSWMEKNKSHSPELIEQHFGEMPEAGLGESRFTLRMPDVLKLQIDQLARERKLSTNAWIIRCLERCIQGQTQEQAKP